MFLDIVLYCIVVGSLRLMPPDVLQPQAYCTNPSRSYLHRQVSPPETLGVKGGTTWARNEFCLKMPDFHVTFRDLLHAVNLRHGTNGFTSLLEGRRAEDFFVMKNPTASAGFEPANLDNKGQHATSRPPKPLCFWVRYQSHLQDFAETSATNYQSNQHVNGSRPSQKYLPSKLTYLI